MKPLLLFLLTVGALTAQDRYDVVWDSPSRNSSGSMPLGNGDIGINLWVEPGGDLLFYIGKTDAWSENARLLKLGRVRIRFSPNPFQEGQPFEQRLHLAEGEIRIRAGGTNVRVWVDAHHPVVRVEAEARRRFKMTPVLETWRTSERVLTGDELGSAYGMEGAPHPVVVHPDTVLPEQNGRIVWYHRNATSIWNETMKLQGLESVGGEAPDRLTERTFGGAITGMTRKSAKRHAMAIYALTLQTGSAAGWRRQMDRLIERTRRIPLERARLEHRDWWGRFWLRSRIDVTGAPDAAAVTQGYALQRFVNACAGRGEYPIKFNGSIFTVDATVKDRHFDADYRRWGGPYWFQNTRLIYWPMLASGDFDMMKPFFRMYRRALPLAQIRTGIYFQHEGAFFPETMYFWGAYANSNYGWNRKGRRVSDVENTYIRHYWSCGLELVEMALQYYAYTRDAEFFEQTLLPLADGVLRFYDHHFPRDAHGRLLLKPAQALETWQDVVNPAPDIGGLQSVLRQLLVLQPRRSDWKRLLSEVPPLPVQGTILPAAQILGPIRNVENPELYPIFPFRIFGMGKADLELARRTFRKRRFQHTGGWQQDAVQAALLGLTEIARRFTAQNFSTRNPESRFPTFWGPNFDWTPDQDHGNVAAMALQRMLMQCEGHRILLFPAWPADWDVDFRLHAPFNTTVEGLLRGGRLERLQVTPQSRASDVELVQFSGP